MVHRVDAAMDYVQGSATQPSLDSAPTNPELGELSSRHDPVLPPGDLSDDGIQGRPISSPAFAIAWMGNAVIVVGPPLHLPNADRDERTRGARNVPIAQQKRLQPAGTASGFDPLK